jgi:hypothetical protein
LLELSRDLPQNYAQNATEQDDGWRNDDNEQFGAVNGFAGPVFGSTHSYPAGHAEHLRVSPAGVAET